VSVSIFIQVFNDNITEIQETFSLFVTSTTVCTSSGTDSVTLTFYDPLPILNQITNDTTINCTQSNIPLQNTTSGLFPFKYLWNNGDTLPNLSVSPSQTTTYIVTITDACLIDSKIDSVTVSVITPPFITSLPPDTIDCSIDSVLVGPI